MMTIWQDIRFGLRMLAKHPGFTVVAVLSLALGIGGNTAIFSVVDAVLLDPLPQKDPERLISIRSVPRERAYSTGVNVQTWHELQQFQGHFSDLVVHTDARLDWESEGFVQDIRGSRISPKFFSYWGVRPLLGRTFALDETEPGGPPVIVLSHKFWRNHLGGQADIVGQTIQFRDKTFTVIGVMPARMRHPEPTAGFWLPLEVPQAKPSSEDPEGWEYMKRGYYVSARIAPGVTMEQLQAALDVIARRQAEDCPRFCENWAIEARPLRHLFCTKELRKTLSSLLGAMGFVLLIACANTASLLLARNESRRRELAVRAALGAGRWRLVRQLLTESILLASLGGFGGLLIGWWGTRLLKAFIPWYVPSIKPISLDMTMLGFTLLVSMGVGLAIGLIPAWLACCGRIHESLKESAAQASVSISRKIAGRLLVVSELALTVVLLTGAALMINSVVRMLRVDPGFDPTNLLRVEVNALLPGERDMWLEAQNQMILQMQERFATLPGVQAAGVGIDVNPWRDDCVPDGSDEPVNVAALLTGVGTSDSLRAMRVPLLAGRLLDISDCAKGRNTIVVNETLARRCWPGRNAVGKMLRPVGRKDRFLEVVGVVGDVRDHSYPWQAGPKYYRPLNHSRDLCPQWYFLLVRTRADPSSLIPALRHEMKAVAPGMQMPSFKVVEQMLHDHTAQHRVYMGYLSCFAAVGLLLSAIGTYGVVAWMVARRTPEIGIRIALGASPRQALELVLRQGLFMTSMGILLGVIAAVALTRFLRSYLFRVSPLDSLSFIGASILLGMIAMLACSIPALRAAKIDPIEALRYE